MSPTNNENGGVNASGLYATWKNGPEFGQSSSPVKGRLQQMAY